MMRSRTDRKGLTASALVTAVVFAASLACAPAVAGGETASAGAVRVAADHPTVADAVLGVPTTHSPKAPADGTVARTAAKTPSATARPAVRDSAASAPVRRAVTSVAVKSGSVGPASASTELAQARAILAGLVARYPVLEGTTVTIGKTPGGYQAVAYYTSGRIVISSTHTASLSRILNHEVWHIIDWRDNHRIDWGENVPPRR